MRILLLLLLVSIGYTEVRSQENSQLDDLKFYADVIANAGNPEHKARAQKEFSTLFDNWINSDAFDTNELEGIQWLSVKSPEDESFKLITWQLQLSENEHSYYGYIIRKGTVHKLKAAEYLEDLEYDVLSKDDWASAMYYNILTVHKNDKPLYILFGYNGYKDQETRKLAEVLTFDGDEPVFGYELFKRQEEGERGVIKNRLVLDYSSDANVSLNYNPGLKMIVQDHLIPRMGRMAGQGPTMLPDGSYVGYEWDGQYFNYVDKLYHQTQSTPPMPKPVIGKEKSNIFGSKDKKKTKKH